MKRRDLIKGIGAGSFVALLPAFLTKNNTVVAETVAEGLKFNSNSVSASHKVSGDKNNFFNSAEIHQRVLNWMNKPELISKFPFVAKTKIVDVGDEELVDFGFKGTIFAADLIADDQESITYQAGVYTTVNNSVPKIKIGNTISETTLKNINLVALGLDKTGKKAENLEAIKNSWSELLATGLLQRLNALIASMYMQRLRNDGAGLKYEGEWGAHKDLRLESKVHGLTSNIKLMIGRGKKYKKAYNHMMLSQELFIKLFSSDPKKVRKELKEKGAERLINIVKNHFKLDEVEIYDQTITERSANGAILRKRVVPENTVILSSTKDRNDRKAADLANGEVIESIVASLLDKTPSVAKYGPYSYYTGSIDMNPPSMIVWSTMRCFPRLHDLALTGVIEVTDLDERILIDSQGVGDATLTASEALSKELNKLGNAASLLIKS